MGVEVEFTDESGEWFDALFEDEQDSVAYSVQLLEQLGPTLPFPHSSAVVGSRYSLRELRVQHRGSPMRVFYGFDPRRSAILLCGGSKHGVGDKRFYGEMVPRADRIWGQCLLELEGKKTK